MKHNAGTFHQAKRRYFWRVIYKYRLRPSSCWYYQLSQLYSKCGNVSIPKFGQWIHIFATWDQLPSTVPLTVPLPCLSKRPLRQQAEPSSKRTSGGGWLRPNLWAYLVKLNKCVLCDDLKVSFLVNFFLWDSFFASPPWFDILLDI